MTTRDLEITVPVERISIPRGHALGRVPLAAGLLGLLSLGAGFALGLGGLVELSRLWPAYLVSWLFFLSLGLGGLFFVLLQFVTRAGWSVPVRRLAENLMGTLPLLAVLGLPLLAGLEALYPWAREGATQGDPLLAHKEAYLNRGFFLLRSAVYLASWALLAWWFRRRSLAQDEGGDRHITRRLQTASAPALVVFGLTATFAAFDWIMSLDPHWYSTIFGVYFFSGAVVAGLAVLILLALILQGKGLLSGVVTSEHLHDLGKLLFAFTVFWAYIAFSQFMLIWYANLPEETVWYAQRLGQGWKGVSVLLAVGHFVLPFFFLLPREVKRRRGTLLAGAVWLLAMHYLDLYWLVMPNHGGFRPHLLDLMAFLGIGGLFLAALALLTLRSRLIPTGDPRLPEALSSEHG